jgi:hypothetical protein
MTFAIRDVSYRAYCFLNIRPKHRFKLIKPCTTVDYMNAEYNLQRKEITSKQKRRVKNSLQH